MTKEELVQKLISKKQAPFLFLGLGFSLHYINTPDWLVFLKCLLLNILISIFLCLTRIVCL